MNQDPQLFNLIKQACTSYESIIAAYVFGSQTTNQARPASDVDIALLLEPEKVYEIYYL